MSLEFKGINVGGYAGYELTSIITTNLKWWLDWGFLNNGAYGIHKYADPTSQLMLLHDNRYEDGRVWSGYGREWVWESGVVPASGMEAPFRVSGVYIDGTFYPKDTTGMFSHKIDYQNGRIIFNSPQTSGADVRAEYCSRYILVENADNPNCRQLMSWIDEDFTERQNPSSNTLKDLQVWLPAVFIDVGATRQRGLQLGGGQIKTISIILYVFADSINDRDLLKNWLDYQGRSAFYLADLNQIDFPLNAYGEIVDGATNFVELAEDHPWKKIRLMDSSSSKVPALSNTLFRGKVIWSAEVDFGGI